LYFVDHTTGYLITVYGPRGTPEPLRSGETFPTDPRGEPIRIHGIGLDNLPEVMQEPLKIINSQCHKEVEKSDKMMMNKPLTFGIIGAGIAIAAAVGVLFVMPLVTAPAPTTPPPPSTTTGEILPSKPGGYEELRAQDPVFDNFVNTLFECSTPALSASEEATKPSTITCRQTIQNGMTNWCGVGENYHAEKCQAVNEITEVYDIISR
jgi:hypothetical protein